MKDVVETQAKIEEQLYTLEIWVTRPGSIAILFFRKDDLIEEFSKAGRVVNAYIPEDRETRYNRTLF